MRLRTAVAVQNAVEFFVFARAAEPAVKNSKCALDSETGRSPDEDRNLKNSTWADPDSIP